MKPDAQLLARVRKGETLLSKAVPRWRKRIDLDRLALDGCFDCILGQVFKDYSKGHEALFSQRFPNETTIYIGGIAAEYGFTTRDDDMHSSRWKDLTAAWKYVLERAAKRQQTDRLRRAKRKEGR